MDDEIASDKVLPNAKLAMEFYREYILQANKGLDPLLSKYKFKSRIPSWKWELFAAILVGDFKKEGYGVDLINHEVKSYLWGGAPEYQYHRLSWKEKLEEDKRVDHILIWYKDSLEDVDVYLIHGPLVAGIFESWREDISTSYDADNPEKRCRKALPKSVIENLGKIILKIRNGQSLEALVTT